MNLTGFALNNSRLTMLITVILMVAGIALFFNFPSKEDPEVAVREAVVMAAFPGMSTARVEDQITRKLEKEIRRIPEMKKITASSKTGLVVMAHLVDQGLRAQLASGSLLVGELLVARLSA